MNSLAITASFDGLATTWGSLPPSAILVYCQVSITSLVDSLPSSVELETQLYIWLTSPGPRDGHRSVRCYRGSWARSSREHRAMG